MSNEVTNNNTSNIAVSAPLVTDNNGSGNLYFQPGTPGEFAGQQILNNQETGAFVNEIPGLNRAQQLANQSDIFDAIGKQLKRKTQLPAFSPINSRETGGIFTPDNNSFNGINFGGALTSRGASTALIPDLTSVSVSQDGLTLVQNNLFLVKDGAIPSQYTAVDALADSNVDISVTLDGVTIDGVVLSNTKRVALTGQLDASENGLYTVHTGPAVPTRSTDMDTTGEVVFGKGVTVSTGTVYTGAVFIVTQKPAALDTDPLIMEDVTTQAGSTVTHAFDGLYIVGVVGGGLAPLTRATSMNTAVEASGAVVNVTSGTANGGKTFLQLQTNVVTLGVTPLDFENYAEFLPTALTQPVDTGVEFSDSQVYFQA